MNATPRLLPIEVAAPAAPPRVVTQPRPVGASLLRDGLVEPHALVRALSLQRRHDGRLSDMLLTRGLVGEGALYAAASRHYDCPVVDPVADAPDGDLLDRFGAAACLRESLLPWRAAEGVTTVLTAHPEEFARHRLRLEAMFGAVDMALAPSRQIEAAVLGLRAPALREAAEARVPEAESCRNWGRRDLRLGLAALACASVGALIAFPGVMMGVLVGWALLTLAMCIGLRGLALMATLRMKAEPPPVAIIARPPVVSIMVALFREANIAPRLVRRLSRLEYPRDLLDVLLVVEEADAVTRRALARADLPAWMRVVVVPDGTLRTKPRALNFALDLCRGTIVGVYDAEDAPEPDQIRKMVERFHQRAAEVACLQGVLDFYNPRTNWLARCFTMEYAAWFRVILPGLDRLGLPVPLGGTTLFFRRAALESLGGWDAHNVTEDADLGMRLARHGFRTELIDTVTEEEANCRTLPWIRQRSRWLKGYMMTWGVHMRDPVLLWRQLGAWKFAGFQVLFLGTLSQFLLTPLIWSFWLLPLGLRLPYAPHGAALVAMVGLFLLSEAINLTATVVAMRRTRHRFGLWWLAVLHVYFPLGALASYKAAWELVARPFFWDKTSHGIFDRSAKV